MTDMNQPRLSGIVRLIRTTFTIILVFQLISGIIFSFYFKSKGYFDQWPDAIFHGFYQAISAVTNAGFDITGNSLLPFANDYLFLHIIMFLIFVGGIGFPAIMDFHEWIKFHRIKERRRLPFRFTLFTKIAALSFVILFIGGAISIFFLEHNHLFKDLSPLGKWTSSLFYSITTRSAGMQVHDLNQFQVTTLLVLSALMFVGCRPSSVGGGSSCLWYNWTFIRNNSQSIHSW